MEVCCWAIAEGPSEEAVIQLDDTAFSEGFDKLYAFSGGIETPATFSKLLIQYMNNANVSVEALAFDSKISERTIADMRNRDSYQPKLKNVIAICIALHLKPSFSYHLIEAAGYKLTPSRQNRAYEYILDSMYMRDIDDCNKFLKKANLKPL